MAHSAHPTSYMAESAGSARISPVGEFEAGSFQEFVLTYTAGYFGIDDTGSLKIVHRFASDMGKPQFDDPAGPNFVTVEASNGAALAVEYDGKRNVRPWDKTLFIRVVKGFLREGDQIIVRLGDRRSGSPGMRVQTFCEHTFEFKVLVDPWATYTFIELLEQPTVAIVAGRPVRYVLVGPTIRRVGEAFRLGFKGEDKWGNPSHLVSGRFRLNSSAPVEGLPNEILVDSGSHATIIEGLRCHVPGLMHIDVRTSEGTVVARSGPIQIAAQTQRLAYWADLHGQSEETIGTNSARDFILFGRDRAFLDVMSHQGNDFQITQEFWEELNRLTREFNEDGRFIVFPGYEWSGNTSLGGDRNVLFADEGRAIHRSHHALIEDLSDVATDAHTANDLFEALKGEDCMVFAHIGGRYADIKAAHNRRMERSIEIHSDWGTFEWLLQDAFDQQYRVGILANSDGHKGRQGASHPGASLFGAYGGLSCILAKELTRESILDALRHRRHYATTGSRLILDVSANLDGGGDLFDDDPAMGGNVVERKDSLGIGDIARYEGHQTCLNITLHAASPLERVEILNGGTVVKDFVPEGDVAASRRIRILWEGSEYRGRGRQTIWDGNLALNDNAIERIVPINWWNLDKCLDMPDDRHLRWEYLTTGGFGGIEIWLSHPRGGEILLNTEPVKAAVLIEGIGSEELRFEAGGLGRRVKIYRLPEQNTMYSLEKAVQIPLAKGRDNPLYVRARTEDGHMCWSSPIYLID
ncbi:DUF3604 domain-containing protein [Sulfuritalea hydrogenivorans]|uniref:DUF3604 domain-containing protein n=1 Tax=Sulfuritalea hydrogenivorans sk43H TaxID=1223802 RepID=W0SBF5_9PROT|nr:DUF3604 domain-containing protein [Sulfuritalea hydrogenivorans]BAO28326.1 hypothetical protein SUTH_00512 [Sulfuritalea hydrogenivorans sk43H]